MKTNQKQNLLNKRHIERDIPLAKHPCHLFSQNIAEFDEDLFLFRSFKKWRQKIPIENFVIPSKDSTEEQVIISDK